MHINVRDILAEDIGYNRGFLIDGEWPELELVKLVRPISGEATITRLEDSLEVRGRIETEIELDCHRCLGTFTHFTKVGFSQIYSEHPTEDEMPVVDGSIDLAPIIGQEITVHLPIKLLCKTDCGGVEGVNGKYTKEEESSSLRDRARIKKGSK